MDFKLQKCEENILGNPIGHAVKKLYLVVIIQQTHVMCVLYRAWKFI